MRIFAPIRFAPSRAITRAPARPAKIAAIRPAAPAPITAKSKRLSSITSVIVHDFKWPAIGGQVESRKWPDEITRWPLSGIGPLSTFDLTPIASPARRAPQPARRREGGRAVHALVTITHTLQPRQP